MSANPYVDGLVVVSVLVALAVTAVCISAAREAHGRATVRRYVFAAAVFIWCVCTSAWLGAGEGVPAAWASAGWIAGGLAAGVGLAMAPGAPRTFSGAARTLVDGLIVAASALLVAWLAGLGSVFDESAGETLLMAAVMTQLSVGAAAIVILTRAREAARRPLVLVAGSLTAMAFSAFALAWLAWDPGAAPAAALLAVCTAAWLAMAIAAHGTLPVEDTDEVEPGLPTRASVFIPSVPFAIAVVAAAAAGMAGEFEGFVIAVSAAILVLVVIRQILALVENISFWRRLEEKVGARTDELRQSEARFRSLVQHASDVITVIDARGEVGYQSPSTFAVFGYEPDEIEGPVPTELIHDEDIDRAVAAAEELMDNPGSTISVEGKVRSRTGGWRHVEAIATNLLHDPAVEGLVVNTRDITERKQLEEALTFRAFHDPLTNLPNRALFADRLAHALSRSTRRADSIAVMFLDLDEFKNINDSLGHGRGDELLAAVGARLLNCMRDTDTVARLGGDEFAVLIEDAEDVEAAAAMAKRILRSLETSLQVGPQQVIARASMGIAVSPDAGTTAEELLRAADVAMYAAKANGRGGFEFFEPSMRAALLERMELENNLRDAVDRGQLFLEYQPIVSLDGTLHGTEALVRWRHPKHGVLPPGRFIGLAEERGFMNAIGSWVLRTACAQAAEWRRRFPETAPARMVVNLSTTQLEHPGLVEDVELALLESGLDPANLVLELTESVVLESEAAIAKLGQLREWGVRVSIDDFGTGYSSLSYLRRLPLDILKIDRSFIDGIDRVPHQRAIVEAILVMCARLGIEPVAEGVEREAEAEELRRLHCGLAQGFYFERPSSAEKIASVLAESPAVVAVPGPGGAAVAGRPG